MSEEMREMAVYHQLVAKKAGADEKIKEISRRADVFIRKVSWVLVLVLAVTMGLLLCLRFAGVYQVHDLVLVAIFSGIGVVVFFSFSIPYWYIGAVKKVVFKWWEEEHHTSFAELQELFEQLKASAPGSDERVALTYTYMTRLAIRKALHEIVDSLRENFLGKIPNDEAFYQRVQDILREDDENESVDCQLFQLLHAMGSDYPAPLAP
jgi:hypothetical protein